MFGYKQQDNIFLLMQKTGENHARVMKNLKQRTKAYQNHIRGNPCNSANVIQRPWEWMILGT